MGPVLGPHARTDRTRDTRVAEPWLPAPEDRRPGEGQRLTPNAPHNGGRPPPPGTAPHHPRGTQPPQGIQAKGTVLGPHSHTPAPTARGCVPFVNRLFESEIQGTLNFTYFCYVLLVTWCHRVLLSCYLRLK